MSSLEESSKKNYVPTPERPVCVHSCSLHNLLQEIKRTQGQVDQDLIDQAYLLKERIGELPPKIRSVWDSLCYRVEGFHRLKKA